MIKFASFIFNYLIQIIGRFLSSVCISYEQYSSIKPFLKYIKIYIRVSTSFLDTCDKNTDQNADFATFNEVGIYRNILRSFEPEAVKYFLLKYKEYIPPKFNIPFILEPIDFISKSNTCVFDSKYFLQLQGTAMDTIFAPTYIVNLSTEYHKIKLYDINKPYCNFDIRQYFMENRKRFLDNCVILSKTDIFQVRRSCNNASNSINNDIQYSIQLSDNKIPLLDILVCKIGE